MVRSRPFDFAQGRHATSIENDALRLTVLHEGGHITGILDKTTGVTPLWIPCGRRSSRRCGSNNQRRVAERLAS